jgi:hypothetical protein
VPNPYRDDIFRRTNDGSRPIDRSSAARFDKVAVLLTALGRLQTSGLRPGCGDRRRAEPGLRRQAERRVADCIEFAGPRRGAELRRSRRILVVFTVG